MTWRRKLDDIMVRLKDLPVGDERSKLVGEGSALRSEAAVQALARTFRASS